MSEPAARRTVLIVDDEESIRDSLRLLLKSNFDVHTAADGNAALSMFETVKPDLMLLDVVMPEMGGLDTLRQMAERGHCTPVIMLTGSSTVKTAVQAMQLGARDYINKPFDIEELTSAIVRTLEHVSSSPGGAKPEADSFVSRSQSLPEGDFGPLVGRSPAMLELYAKVKQVAVRDTTVLITGESGTGKELIARRIHDISPRAKGPFVAINCAAIPETLIESELFGHEKGAFTHAVEKRLGHFELADGGTLFLDEIGELSLAVQVKMLRFLQEHEFFRVGRSKPIKVDVRIVTATNRQLEDLIREGRFRQDLFYRINVINIGVPPLRDRFEDIPYLTTEFLKRFSTQYANRNLTISEPAIAALIEYHWPGNVRELENTLESLIALNPRDEVQLEDLPRKLREHNGAGALKTQVIESGAKFDDAERAFESEIILKALRKTNYVQTRAAELLGISRRILKYKMDKLGIAERCASVAGESAAQPVKSAGQEPQVDREDKGDRADKEDSKDKGESLAGVEVESEGDGRQTDGRQTDGRQVT